MKRAWLAAAVVALVIPAAAFAADQPTGNDVAVQTCKTAQTQNATLFAQTYKNFGACVLKQKASAQSNVTNAAQQCKAERSSMSASDFAAKYTGANSGAKGKGAGANAFGKCVSTKAKAASDAQAQAIVSAEKQCKAARASDRAGFAKQWKTFGACVASKNKSSQ
jgi:hypothetical protein